MHELLRSERNSFLIRRRYNQNRSSNVSRMCNRAVVWFFSCLMAVACEHNVPPTDRPPSDLKKYNQAELSVNLHESASEQLFLNLGMKKRWKDTNSKLENAIFKSRIEVLGEIFRTRVDILKADSKVELIFLVDSSSSVGEENFKSELKFVHKLVADFTVSPGDARLAVVTFASSVETHVNHLTDDDHEHEKCSLLHLELPAIKYSGGNTFTLGALLEAQRILNGSRPGASRALFLITDGFSNNGYPVPTAKELKENGVNIFTFGIKSGNVEELYKMSSEPPEEHSFLLESFAEFEALARRALHQDLKPGSYMNLKNSTLCDNLCPEMDVTEENSCCNQQSRCSCGTLTGHFVCLCPPGHYGSGLIGEKCLPCPNGTYHDGNVPGDILVCRPCPDSHQETIKFPATSKKDCKCKDGFIPAGDKCKVVTCPQLSAPVNGFFVKNSCSNVLHAACGVRCSIGYELIGSSVRLCQKNGTWSGSPPQCVAKRCEKLKPVPNSEMTCRSEEEDYEVILSYDAEGKTVKQLIKKVGNGKAIKKFKKMDAAENTSNASIELNYTIDTECRFSCFPGFSLVGSKLRTCLPVARWNGLQTTCKAIICPSLPAVVNGTILPSNCTSRGIKHGFEAECQITCDPGFLLKGPKHRNCTGKYGTWTGKNTPSKCIDIEPPKFECPQNKTIFTDENAAFATVNWSLPDAVDNSGVKPILWSKPPFEKDFPIKLEVGITEILIQGMDTSGNIASCSFHVQVRDTEPPNVIFCESPPVFFLSNFSEIKWEEPIFTDNLDGPINVEKSHTFGEFPVGITPVTYTAWDVSRNSAECVLNITALKNPCSERPVLSNVILNCSEDLDVKCLISCPEGLTLASSDKQELQDKTLTCTHKDAVATWVPDYFQGDLDLFPDCSASTLSHQASQSEEIILDIDDNSCENLEELTQELNKEVNDILQADQTQVIIQPKCVERPGTDVEEETNQIQSRKKRSPNRELRIDVSLIGVTSKYSSTEAMINGLKTSGEKFRNHFFKKDFIKSKGKHLKIKTVQPKKEPTFTCKNGTVARGDLCVNCPIGTFYSYENLFCTSCPVGEFQNTEGQLSCVPCRHGYSTRKSHSRNPSDCKMICPKGTFGRRRRSNSLSLSPCTPCDLGHYQPEEGQHLCSKCPAGKNTLKRGSTNPDDCISVEQIKNPCSKSPCRNNGTCYTENGFATCSCLDGFLGAFCEKRLDPCESSPCYNNGQCRASSFKTYVCVCASGYMGFNCQIEINECDFNPCANGAECTDVLNGYICECLPGFTGKTCNKNINECETLSPCMNNGTCMDLINDYRCSCGDKYIGSHCEQNNACDQEGRCSTDSVQISQAPDLCSSMSCPVNMECEISKLQPFPFCVCRKGYHGQNCSEVVDPDVFLIFPKCSVTDYLTADFPPMDIHEVSVCLWVKTKDNFNYGTLFSYATQEEDNAFTFTDYNGFVLYVRSKRVITDITANDGLWHFICIMWQSKGGSWQIYVDGLIKADGYGLSSSSAIPGGGKLVVGQEQDFYGGGFNEVESFVGKMTYLDIWDRILEKEEIVEMNKKCDHFSGNLINWVQFLAKIHGNIKVEESTFCKSCPINLTLFRGKITFEEEENSFIAQYECDEGFYIVFEHEDEQEHNISRIWVRKCQKHGDWEPNPPKCGRVKCGFPGYFPQGFMAGNSYLYSDMVTYRCNTGFKLRGSSFRVCQADGTWSGEKPFCQGNSSYCRQLTAPRHGSMFLFAEHEETESMYSAAEGTKVEFTCDEGYILDGMNVSTCLEDGIWDHYVPVCNEIRCSLPGNISDLIYEATTKESFATGETLKVKCRTRSHESTIVCDPTDGKWNISVDACHMKCLEKPGHPHHGYILDDGRSQPVYQPGDIVQVNCRYGYRMSGDNFVKCSSDGVWTQAKKTLCQPIECGSPVPIPHSTNLPHKQGYYYGDLVVFRCLPGYQKYGSLSIRCEAEARWSRIRGRCEMISCGRPTIPNGIEADIAENSTYLFEDTIRIKCPLYMNFEDNSTNFIKCQANGQWTQLPSCA